MAKGPEPKIIINEGAPEWVVTFGDLMSLLLCFFVLLLSFSEMDRQKYKMLSGSMANAFGVQKQKRFMEIPKGEKIIATDFDQETIAFRLREEIFSEIMSSVKAHLQGMEELVKLTAEGGKLKIQMMGETTFDSGKAEIRPQMKPVLEKIGEIVAKNTEGEIVVGGHTDDVPIHGGKYGSNLVLSMARAAQVAEFLIKEAGVEEERIATMGFGEYRPIDTNETPEGRQKNRRVEIILSSSDLKMDREIGAEIEREFLMQAPAPGNPPSFPGEAGQPTAQ